MESSSMAVSLIALVSSITTMIIGWLKERDKLRFDMRLKELEWKQAECEKQSLKQAEKIKELERRDDEDKEMLSVEIETIKKKVIDNPEKI